MLSQKQELAKLNTKNKETETEIKALEQVVKQTEQETDDLLSRITDQERAAIFIELANDPENKDLIEQLLELGIDWYDIIKEAITHNREDLLEYAINHGVDFDQETGVRGSTAIERAIKYKSPLLGKMLESTADLSNSLTHIIERDNVKALKTRI